MGPPATTPEIRSRFYNCLILLQIEYGTSTKVKVLGHSPKEMGMKGENLLCAGVSVLTQSVFLYFWNEKKIKNYSKKDGLLEFEIIQSAPEDMAVLKVLILGFQNLQTQHPNLLSIEIGEKNGT